jgi:L-ascorbate metabolism protein UlaG (beta-lactamase superfamily)
LSQPPSRTVRGALITLLGLLAAATTFAQGLDVTYIGNAGFLVSAGEQRVLVDGLYRQGAKGYVKIPAEELEKLEQAKVPYDGIDLVLVTHHHADHFDPQSVARHLANNPEALFVSTPQAVDLLESAVGNFEVLAPRVRAELPAEGESVTVDLPGIKVRALNLHHGRDRTPPVEHLVFVVEIGGQRFAHFGDTQVKTEELAIHKLERQQIDLAFVGYWELQRGGRRRLFHENVDPARVVATHVPSPDAPPSFFGDAATLEAALEQIRRAMPDVVIFEKQFETKRILPPEKDS